MRHLRLVGLAVLAMLVVASPASAQRTRARSSSATQGGFWELGTDAGATIGLSDPKSLSIDIPIGMLRAGYFASDVLSFEPALSLSTFAAKGFRGSSSYILNLAVLYHVSPDRTKQQVFIHPLVSILGGSGGFRTRTGLGAGVGVKKPMINDRIAGRGEVNLTHYLKSGTGTTSFTNLAFLAGFSVYTK
jgi:hypothetical protein